jgi:hypothetical protein
MKPWIAAIIRGLLITIVGFAGLIGLLMSACGLLLGNGAQGRITSFVVVGFLGAATCVGFVVWVSFASHRGLKIALSIFLGCLLLLWLIIQRQVH